MLKTQRRRYTAEFKARLALEVVKGERTLNEIASEHGIHPGLLLQWKQRLIEELPSIFADKRCQDEQRQQVHEAQLYQQIGQLKFELDWLKKKAGLLERRERLGR